MLIAQRYALIVLKIDINNILIGGQSGNLSAVAQYL